MAALADAGALATDTVFAAKVKAAAINIAFEMALELKALETVTARQKMHWRLCRAILEGPDVYGPRFAWALATIPIMDDQADDATIRTQVTNCWDVLAGIPI